MVFLAYTRVRENLKSAKPDKKSKLRSSVGLVLSRGVIPSFYQLLEFNVRKEAVQLPKYTNCSQTDDGQFDLLCLIHQSR